MKNQQTYLMAAAVVLIVGAVSFYGGMQYQKSQILAGRQYPGAGNGQMMGGRQGAPGVRGDQGTMGGGTAGGRQFGAGAIMGEILKSDDSTITVKAQDGSGKIVVLSESTVINTASAAAKSDLTIGATVNAFGVPNADGSITASTIQILPAQLARRATAQ